MLTTSLSQSKFTYSSRRNPCPVCGRTKDSDCRWDEKLLHCRTYAKEHLRVGEVIRGHDGQQWAYLGDSDGGRWAMFRPHRERRYDRKPKSNPSAKRPTAPSKPASKTAVAPPTVAKKAPRPAGQQEFIYHDVDGQPVIKVVREDDGKGNKDIHQFRWENGQWVARLNDEVTKRVRLYRIAEARALSQKTGYPIFLVEGESCVERLMALGLPATTSIGGAGKWRKYGFPNYLQDLSSLRVILCPDADRAGLDHMLDVEKSLRQNGIEVAGWLLAPPDAPWENLPTGGGLDVVDWLENGATAEEIVDSVRVALPDYLAAEDETTDLATEENDTRNGKKKSVAQLLIELALKSGTLWHDSTGAGWIDFTVDGNQQTARIRSKRFRDFLSRVLWQREKRSVSSEGWSEAVNILEGLARFDGPEREAFLRVGKHEGAIYIDLGTEDWRIIRVSPTGWDIIPYSECPIRFYRADCQLPLPIPTRDGSLDDLWQLLNVRESDRPLVLGWILSTLTPDGSKPILCFSGEKGSGKSSAASLLKRLTDPTHVDMSGGVEDQRQFAVAAANRWVLCFDNLTHLSSEQQNLLCRASTGGGFTYRALYTDLDEVSVNYRRPQILTGVDLVPTRSDILERCLIVRLERIPEKNRLSERKLESLTSSLLPGIYGSLLDLMVVALRNLPTINLDELPRMADFAELCIAAGIPSFVEAYTSNIETGCQAAVEASPLAEGILSLLDAHNGYWQGTATELVQRLQALDPTNRGFQKLSASSIGKKMASSLKSDLAAVGVTVKQGKGNNGQRYLTLSRVESQKTMPQSPPVSTPSLDKEEEEQSPPIALPSVTPEKNNGATAVPSTSSSTNAPARPEVAALQSGPGRVQRTTDDPVIDRGWYRLMDVCCEVGVSHGDVRAVLAEATEVALGDVENIPLTREQYNRALEYIRRWPSRTYAHHQPEQVALPVESSAGGIPPWLWEG